MPARIVETQCLASVLVDGHEHSLLKNRIETVTSVADPAGGRLQAGKFYRVIYEEIPCLSEPSS